MQLVLEKFSHVWSDIWNKTMAYIMNSLANIAQIKYILGKEMLYFSWEIHSKNQLFCTFMYLDVNWWSLKTSGNT